jgi:hypothetical protein
MVKNVSRFLLLFLLFSGPLVAQDMPTRNGEVYASVQVDLDGDGEAEEVQLLSYGVTADQQFYGQLQVADIDGNVLWTAPRAGNPFDPYAFGGWHIGFSGLDMVGDLNSDGTVNLISARPVSDVRPPTYRRFAWTGKEFVTQGTGTLIESPKNSGRYRWSQDDTLRPGRWISGFEAFMANRTVVVNVTQYVNNSSVLHGRASVVADDNGFHIVRWEEAPR